MSFSKISALTGLAAFASTVAAHGTVTGIVADGVYYQGYSPSFKYLQTQPKVVGWSIPDDSNNGFVAPDAYGSGDIICHLNATNAQISAPVKAGGVVELQWTPGPSSSWSDYLANCNGDCSTVDKSTLKWFKIDAQGLKDDTTVTGTWASDTLIANNNSWSVTIPSDVSSGNYVLRHEIIALHSAGQSDGAQNYPQCVNLEIAGTGTATPSGTLGTALYSETDPGILFNIYATLSTYVIPGPALYSSAVSMSQITQPTATSGAASITSPAITSSSSIPGAPTKTPIASAPYGNVTLPYATSSKTPKSACRVKSKTTSAATLATPSSVISNAFTTETLAVTSANSVTIATTAAAVLSTTPSSPVLASATSTASASTSPEPTSLPKGTTLDTLFSWISSFYDKVKGTKYDSETLARRHARDIAA